jgi:hypothetical protein
MMSATTAQFLLPFLGHVALVGVLLVVLTIQRVGAVLAGEAKVDDYARAGGDAPRSRRVQRNLSNQFELPLFAYFAAAVLIATQSVGFTDIVAAWVFLGGRVLHSAVQCLSDNVRLRGLVFLVNAAAVFALIGHVAMLVWAALAQGGPLP